MTKSEINQTISQLERDIAEAEKNIRQLNASCNNYQAEFESARTARKIKREDINQILK